MRSRSNSGAAERHPPPHLLHSHHTHATQLHHAVQIATAGAPSSLSLASLSSTGTGGSSPHLHPALTHSVLHGASRSFFIGLLMALLICAIHLCTQPASRRDQAAAASWRQHALQRNAQITAAASSMREVSDFASEAADDAQRAAEAKRSGYSRRAVVDRFRTDEEVEHMNDVKVAGVPRAPGEDVNSWQATMALARKAAGGPKSMRVRAAKDGAAWTETAATALRQTEEKRVLDHKVRRRVHPLVGPSFADFYKARTLIIYSFVPNDQEALANMEFFIASAVRESHNADYIFVIQSNEWRPVNIHTLPKLPPNARYTQYRGDQQSEECGGLGVVGWLLSQQHHTQTERGAPRIPAAVTSTTSPLFVAFGHYAYTMILDSSMRGPWFPAWIDLDDPARVWFAAYAYHLERHAPEMRLVGSTISCQYGQPHVQLGAIMLDAIGWDLLDADRSALMQCVPPSRSVTHTAISLSQTMLRAGGNIGSQMLSYQELDFRVTSSVHAQTCLGMTTGDPQYDEVKGSLGLSDGHYMDPHELVFVKYLHEFKHYKSETFSDWTRWEAERSKANAKSSRYSRRWTEADFRNDEEPKSKEEEARAANLPYTSF